MGYTELIGLALAAAGTATSVSAARNAREAMNNEANAQVAKQAEFQREASPIFNQNVENSTPQKFQQQQQSEAQNVLGRYAQIQQGVPNNPLPVDQQRLQLMTNRLRQNQAQAQGLQQGFQNWTLGNMGTQSNLGVISNLAGSSARNAGILTQLAGQQSADMAGMGSLLSTAGSLAALYGAAQSRRTATAPMGTLQSQMGPQ